jgi:hypothetical protein
MADELAEEPAKFREIGHGIIEGVSDVVTAERAKNVVARGVQEAFDYVITNILKGFGYVANYIAERLIAGEDGAEESIAQLSATAVSDLFGVNISAGALRARGGGGGRGQVGDALGAAIINALIPKPASLEPSDAAAQRYVAAVTKFGIEGWLSGFTMEFMSSMWGPFGHLETFGELDDILAKSLGFERLSRSALGPYVDTLIRTPTEWQLNKLYRPHLLTPSQAARQYFRGRWPLEQVFEEMARQGYSQERIEALLNEARKSPSVGDLYLLHRYGQISEAEALQRLRDEGWEEADASRVWQVERIQRIDSYQKSLANVAVDAYAARRIEPGDFDRILGGSVTDPEERARLREVAEARRAMNIKDLSEGDAKDAVIRGILSVVDYRRVLERAGYTPDAVTTKELLLRDVINSKDEADRMRAQREAEQEAEQRQRDDERRARQAAIEAERAVTEPSIGQAARFVIRGLWDTNAYAAFLRAERYDDATIAALVADVLIDRDEYLERLAERDAAEQQAARKELSLGQLESAVMRGVLTIGDYRGAVAAAGFTGAQVDVLARTLQARLDEQRELEERRNQLEPEAEAKGISLSQAEQAVLRGIGSVADYDAWLRAQDYGDYDRAVLTQLLTIKLADQAAAEARRVEQEAAAARRNVPLADVRRAVLLGVRPSAVYQQALQAAGINGAEAVLLQDLLEADLAKLREDERRRAEAAARRPVQRLSLAQLEALVRFELLTPDQYRAELRADGWIARDVELLTALLLDRIEAERLARAVVVDEEEPPPPPALTLAQLERAVREGLVPIGVYEDALRARGYGDADVALLVGLLATELEAQDAATERRAELLAQDPGRALSVGQLERAVRSGVQTLDDYQRALRALNFESIDAALLTAVLARELNDVVWARARRAELLDAGDAIAASLAAAELGVLEGRTPLDQYRAELTRLGVDLAGQTALLIWIEAELGIGAEDADDEEEG